jgi:hypothetical protein
VGSDIKQNIRRRRRARKRRKRYRGRIRLPTRLSGDRLCGLVVRVLGYRSGGPGSIPGTTRKKM